MKQFSIYLVLVFISSQSLLAKECSYSFESSNVKVSWTAFKTPKKIGVGGAFKDLGIKKKFIGKSLKATLEGASFNIDSTSTWTNNAPRDAKIVKFFFSRMSKGFKIPGKIIKVNAKSILMEISLNGVTKQIPLKREDQKSSNKLVATGHMDILDFSMSSSLQSINKACMKLHQGKTWSDVSLNLSIDYQKSCN
jgi:polyisoprenoid-binding protein YceI